MPKLDPLILQITADNKGLDKGLSKSTKSIKGFDSSMGKLLAGGAIVAGLTAIAGAAIGMANEFDASMSIIKAGTGATGKDLAQLQTDFKAVAGSVSNSMEESAVAVADFNTALGLTGPELQDMSASALDVSRAFKEDIGTVISATTRLMGDWNIKAADGKGVMDKLVIASQKSGAGFSQLAQQVVAYGAPLRNMNVGMDEAISMFARFQKEGVNTETIMSGLRLAVDKLATGAIDGATDLQSLVKVIKESDDATGRAIAKVATGSRSYNDFFDAIKGGKFDLEEYTTALDNASGATDKMGEDTKTNADKVKTAWNGIKVKVGNAVNDMLAAIIDFTVNAAKALNEFNAQQGKEMEDVWNFITGGSNAAQAAAKSIDGIRQSVGLLDATPLERMNAAMDRGVSGADARLATLRSIAQLQLRSAPLNSAELAFLDSAVKSGIDFNSIKAEEKKQLDGVYKSRAKLANLEKDNGAAARAEAEAAALAKRTAAEAAAAAAREKQAKAWQDHVDSIKSTTEELLDVSNDLAIKLLKDAKEMGGMEAAVKANAKAVESVVARYNDADIALKKWMQDAITLLPVVNTMMREHEDVIESIANEIEEVEKRSGDLGDTLGITDEEFDKAFAEKHRIDIDNTVAAIHDFRAGLTDSIFSLNMMIDSLEEMGVTGLENFSGLLSGLQSFADAASSFASGNILGGIAGLVGGGVSTFKAMFGTGGMFGSSSDEQLLASQGDKAGKIFGKAWSESASDSMAKLAKTLKTSSGQADVLAAMWHPETMREVLSSIEQMGTAAQDVWAKNLENNVKPVLMTTMGMSESDAAAAMAPLFDEILAKIGDGGEITAEMQRMIEWAESFGITLGDGIDKGAQAAAKSTRELGDDLASMRLKQMSIEDQIADKTKKARKQFRNGLNDELALIAKKAAADKELSAEELAAFKARGREQEKFLLETFQLFQQEQDILDAQIDANAMLDSKLDLLGEELIIATQLESVYRNIANLNGAEFAMGSTGRGSTRLGSVGTMGTNSERTIGGGEGSGAQTINNLLYLDGEVIARSTTNIQSRDSLANSSSFKTSSVRGRGAGGR